MAKRKSVKREIASMPAKNTREWKRKKIDGVCKKDRVETIGDICAVFYGLSRKAVELAAYDKIQRLAALGYSPLEIIKIMEPGGMTESGQ